MFKNINEIEALVSRLMDKLDSAETDTIELEVGDVRIKLGKHTPPVYGMPMPAPMSASIPVYTPPMPMPITSNAASESTPSEAASALTTVNAPLIGVAYAASSPDAAPFVKVGDKVKKGDIICIIEAMKVMNEIESDCDGEVAEILFENGKMVEYGQPLICVK